MQIATELFYVFSQIKNKYVGKYCAQQQKEKLGFLDGYLTGFS
jgi:hypothetical protein